MVFVFRSASACMLMYTLSGIIRAVENIGDDDVLGDILGVSLN